MKLLDDIHLLMDYDISLVKRTLYLGSAKEPGGEAYTDTFMAERAIKGLYTLDAFYEDENSPPITIMMNNPGGNVVDGMAIYDAIGACKSQVNILVYGHAMSMGSIILQAADIRVLAPHSSVMIHMGELYVGGHPEQVRAHLKDSDKFDRWMIDLYWERMKEVKPKTTRKSVKELCRFDKFLTAEEAVAIGLADAILGE